MAVEIVENLGEYAIKSGEIPDSSNVLSGIGKIESGIQHSTEFVIGVIKGTKKGIVNKKGWFTNGIHRKYIRAKLREIGLTPPEIAFYMEKYVSSA